MLDHVPAVVGGVRERIAGVEEAVLDRDDEGGQMGGEVAVGPVALHRCSHEAASVDVDHERQVGAGCGFDISRRGRPVHADRQVAVGQRDLLPGNRGAGVRLSEDRPRRAGGSPVVLRVTIGEQFLGRDH